MAHEPPRGCNIPSSGIVAFTAKLKADDSYPCHTGVLRFGTVLVNEGGGYSRDTGVFTCPIDGFYHITIHVSVYGRGQCAIFKNGGKVVSLYHTTLPDKRSQVASMSSVIKLYKKDEVYVHIFGAGRNDIFATEDNDTVFTGFVWVDDISIKTSIKVLGCASEPVSFQCVHYWVKSVT